MINKDELKDRVLSENTAQGILIHLRNNESDREGRQRRWVWELLQNARDASSDDVTRLVASIKVGDSELVFRHNGRGFTADEVAHLIFHGSTKVDDESTIGQYGSGFLTTHLLSPEIDVSGHLNDGSPFGFCLKREISSVGALSESMDQALDEFYASVDSDMEATSGGFTTCFRYPLSIDSANIVKEGIETLRRCAPFVVVFNRQFRRIDIEAQDETMRFEVIERCQLQQEGLQRVTVGVRDGDTLSEREYILAQGERSSVTIPMEPSEDGSTCLPLEDIPKLFLGFPLLGTENFSFPTVVNSFEFAPTEDRDGVYLGQGHDERNYTNQAIIEEACALHVKLIQFAAESRWKNVHMLAGIPPISEPTSASSIWLQGQLEQLVEQIRETPAVLCGKEPTAPEDAILPVAGNDVGVETLWSLLNEVEDFRRHLPQRNEAAGWCDAIESWEAVKGCESTSFGEVVDGAKLVSHIECETLNNLQGLLREDVCSIEWLNRLYAFLKDDSFDGLIRERCFILDQAGRLDKLSNLYRDAGVDDDLKDIADELLKLRVRESLRDSRLTSLADEVGKGDYGNEDVAQKIIDALKRLCLTNALTDGFAQASPRMLAWIVAQQEWSYLIGFPAFSVGPDDGRREALWLGQQGEDNADIPLAPVKAWAEGLQQFVDLFPWRHIVADAFYSVMPAPDIWQTLNTQGYVRTGVVLTSDRSIGEFLPDEPLPEGEEHTAVETVAVTDLVFLSKDRIGIMARVRDSQDRARLFWRFLTEWLVAHDIESLDPKIAKCECGDCHRYYPASWLVPLVRNRWVPQGNDIRDHATAQSLAKLLRDDWTPASLSETSLSVKLLEAMQITRLNLMREFVVSDDESRAILDNAMTGILASTKGDLSHVSQFVEDMKTDKDLPDYLAERRKRRQKVHENQRLGKRVEELVKESLEGEGFIVKPTGIGSDFVIEHDLIEEGEEIGIELSRNDQKWLVEVKATRDQRVRMTAKQAETAAEKGEGFLLCVVPAGEDQTNLEKDDVSANMRFVQNIGPRVGPLCEDLDALNDLRDDATANDDSDIQLEIQAGTARVRVDNTVWENGVRLEDLPSQLQ